MHRRTSREFASSACRPAAVLQTALDAQSKGKSSEERGGNRRRLLLNSCGERHYTAFLKKSPHKICSWERNSTWRKPSNGLMTFHLKFESDMTASQGSIDKSLASSAPRLPWPRQCQEPRETSSPSGVDYQRLLGEDVNQCHLRESCVVLVNGIEMELSPCDTRHASKALAASGWRRTLLRKARLPGHRGHGGHSLTQHFTQIDLQLSTLGRIHLGKMLSIWQCDGGES